MTTMINTANILDLTTDNTTTGQAACVTNLQPADFPGVPISTNSPLFKVAKLISRVFDGLFGPASLTPGTVEDSDNDYQWAMPCCA